VEQVLWNCEVARDVWVECSNKTKKCPSMEVGFINIFLSLIEKMENKELERAVIVARLIWLCRNSVVSRGDFSLLSNIKNLGISHIKTLTKWNKGGGLPAVQGQNQLMRSSVSPI
jgi:hypothetical protein